ACTICSTRWIGCSVCLPFMKMMTLLDFLSGAISSRLQNGLFSASSKLFGPSARLLTALTPPMVWTRCVSLWIRLRYRCEEISRDDTARITSGCDGKRRSIFLVWRIPGSLVEKKKFWSTTGFRSTNVATRRNNPPVMININQCDRNGIRTRVTAVKGRCPGPLDDRVTKARAISELLPLDARQIAFLTALFRTLTLAQRKFANQRRCARGCVLVLAQNF